ncbi:pilus assembly protein N-terminal domain-containing protein [Methylobacterium iners]|nr:pilus assembly protein N-terminal domain-containing protein [Methylobacterium iners]
MLSPSQSSRPSRICRQGLLTVVFALAVSAATAAEAPPVVTVIVDNAKVIRLPEATRTVIVGNPMIADISLQKNGVVVLTGKSFGATNLIALDKSGGMLAESTISVEAQQTSVVMVQRGLERESYSCTPNCQPSVQLGDSTKYFGEVSGQATQRGAFAAGGNGAK